MKALTINEEFIREFEFLRIGFENCEVYAVPIADILEIKCNIAKANASCYFADDGFIKISARAKNLRSVSYSPRQNDGDFTLEKRLSAYNDVTGFDLKGNGKRTVSIDIPYDPLFNAFCLAEIENTNCNSFETLENGDMIIWFGKSSKTPKRIQNDYKVLVKGFEENYANFNPKILKIANAVVETFGESNEHVTVAGKIKNKGAFNKDVELVFLSVKDLQIEAIYPMRGATDVDIAKMQNGKFYVALRGLGFGFYCNDIYEYYKYVADTNDIIHYET